MFSLRFPGHYVVVVGYDDEENTIYYKNPSFKRGKLLEVFCVLINSLFILVSKW